MTAGDGGGRLGPVDVDEVERLAGWATRFGPARIRDDVRGEARLRVLEALAAGSTDGLGRVAYRGAMQAFRAATYQAGEWQSRQAWELGHAPLATWDLSEDQFGSRLSQVSAIGRPRPAWSADGTLPTGLGPVLDRLVDVFVAQGLKRDAVVDAISVLVDAAVPPKDPARSGGCGRSRVADVPAVAMAERSGLSVAQCRALKVLLLGERSRPDRDRPARPGLLVRAHRGDAVWSDPRALALIDQVVSPRARTWLGWAERTDREPAVVARA